MRLALISPKGHKVQSKMKMLKICILIIARFTKKEAFKYVT